MRSSQQFQNALNSELFQTARMSPSSLRYYGIGLENGNYTIELQFGEFAYPDSPTWQSTGRRVFDIYLQVRIRCNVQLFAQRILFSNENKLFLSDLYL
jgi:hypothetical protein